MITMSNNNNLSQQYQKCYTKSKICELNHYQQNNITLIREALIKVINEKEKIPQSGICPALCVLNVQSYLHENVVLSVCALMCNAAYVIFIMWNSISGLDAWYHFRLNISCGVAVTVRSHQKNIR